MTIALGGLQPLTTLDFPGRLAAVLFTQGCNLRCAYCHNPELLPLNGRTPEAPSWSEALGFLRRRRGLLDGVVFSGGEPCLQPGLATAMAEAKALGFAVALHTNGTRPAVLGELFAARLVDFVALDVKAPAEGYQPVTGWAGGEAVYESVQRLVAARVEYECRTTFHPEVLGELQLKRLADALLANGVRRFVLQRFRPGKVLDPRLTDPGPHWILPETLVALRRAFPAFELRGTAPHPRPATLAA